MLEATTSTLIGMAGPRWLDETQEQAWRGFIVLVNRGLPRLERTLKEHDLLVVHYSILVALSEAPEGSLRLSELADAANLSQSRLTHRLRRLVERGEVAIDPDAEDGRGKNARITDVGRRRLDAVAPLHVEDVQRLVFDHLDATETECLARAMSKVALALCDHDRFRPEQP